MQLKSFILFILMLNMSSHIKSQNIEFSGSVKDSSSHIAVPFCNVLIKNKIDSIITGTITTDKGNFKIQNVRYEKGIYFLVKCMGYNDKRYNISLNNIRIKYNIGDLFLSEKILNVQETTIEGIQKSVEYKFDRKVFNINNNKTSSANTILDLLRTLPGVIVDDDGNIKYKGAQATIYIDNQPSEFIYPKVEMIPVTNIDKIELIDAASRSGSGKGGIINIRSKKTTTDGLSGLFSIRASTVNFTDLSSSNAYANVNFKHNKIIYFSTLNNFNELVKGTTSTIGKLNLNNSVFHLNEIKEKRTIRNNPFANIGFILEPSKKTKFFVVGYLYNYAYDTKSTIIHQQTRDLDNIYDKYNRSITNIASNIGKAISASYTHSFDTLGKELSISTYIQKYTYKGDENIIYHYNYLNEISVDSTLISNYKGLTSKNEYFLDLFYNHPINSKFRWNFSSSTYINTNQLSKEDLFINSFESYPLSKKDIISVLDQSLSSRIGGKINNWKIDVGFTIKLNSMNADFLRYELDNHDTTISINKKYLNLCPSATISYSLDDTQEIKFTFDRSINAPWVSQFCEFIDKQNMRDWAMGNSKLTSVNYNNFYLGYTYNKEKWNYTTDIFYNLTNNEIIDVIYPNTNITTLTIPENIARKNSFGIDIATWVSYHKNIEFNLSASLFHTILDTQTLKERMISLGLPIDNLVKKDLGFYIKLSTDLKFNSSTSGTFYINYFSKEITFEGYKNNYINSALSFTKKLIDKKLNVSIGINNLFNDLISHGSINDYLGLSQTITENGTRYNRTYFIRLQYALRKGDRGTKNFTAR